MISTRIMGCCLYSIWQNKVKRETHVIGWRTALAHAHSWANDMFFPEAKIEILNENTGEIFSLEEAEKRARNWQSRAAISGTT